MDNEEPELTQIANLQIAHEGHKLPEQSRIPTLQIPRPFGFYDLIHQWQPMGVRVKLNLPFTGNDQDFLFSIRNGPFIPLLSYNYKDSDNSVGLVSGSTSAPDYTKTNYGTLKEYNSFAWNNMHPVTHATGLLQDVPVDKTSVYITQYDNPPALSAFSTMFRRWRGTMHYRIRVVSGFTTQGYIFCSMIRNSPSIPMVYNEFKYTSGPPRQDLSYREAMQNSYVMGDTAMFRHFEVQVPYEYPTPYYDQFAWIGRRSRPGRYFATWQGTDSAKTVYNGNIRSVQYEPHGDNYIVVGLRGALESSVQNSQVTFELEYRAGDDFQFADPFLPFSQFYQYTANGVAARNGSFDIRQLPDGNWTSDGYGKPKKIVGRAAQPHIIEAPITNASQIPAKPPSLQTNAEYEAAVARRRADNSRLTAARRTQVRNSRSIDDLGHDTVDQIDPEAETSTSNILEAARSWLGTKQ